MSSFERPKYKHLPLRDDARKMLSNSQIKASELGSKYIGDEHILLALIQDPTNISSQLIGIEVNPESVKEVINTLIIGKDGYATKNTITPTLRAINVLKLAINEAGNNLAGPQHLLFGIIEEGEGIAAKALSFFGITKTDLPELRKKAKELESEEIIDKVLARARAVLVNNQIDPLIKNKLLVDITRFIDVAERAIKNQNPQN